MNSARKDKIINIIIIPLFSVIIAVLELVLSSLPNIQLTFLLIFVFSKTLSLKQNLLIVLLYVILDNLFMASFSFVYFPFMLIGWMIIPIGLKTIFKKVDSPLGLAFISILFSFIYCYIYLIPTVLILRVDFLTYFIPDIPFEIILALSSFISILWLYAPLSAVLNKYLKKT